MISALPFLLQVGLFFAPIGYSLASLSPALRVIVDLNPLTGVIEATRWIMLSGYDPSFEPLAFALAETVLIAAIGWRVFSRLETTMADVI
jgi:lipopolysaccharide transport system permease protein